MFYVLHYSIPGVGLSTDISQWPVYDTLSNFTAITMLGAQNQYLFSFGTRHAGDSTDTFKRSCHLMGWKINIYKYARVIWHLLKTDLMSNIDQCYIWTSQFTSIVVARYQYALAPPMGMFLPIKQTPKTEFSQLCIGIESFATFRIVWISTKIYIAVSYQICRITSHAEITYRIECLLALYHASVNAYRYNKCILFVHYKLPLTSVNTVNGSELIIH